MRFQGLVVAAQALGAVRTVVWTGNKGDAAAVVYFDQVIGQLQCAALVLRLEAAGRQPGNGIAKQQERETAPVICSTT